MIADSDFVLFIHKFFMPYETMVLDPLGITTGNDEGEPDDDFATEAKSQKRKRKT